MFPVKKGNCGSNAGPSSLFLIQKEKRGGDRSAMSLSKTVHLSLLLEQLPPRRLQPVDDHFRDASHQFITECGLFFALFAQPGSVEENGFGRLYRLRVEMPV